MLQCLPQIKSNPCVLRSRAALSYVHLVAPPKMTDASEEAREMKTTGKSELSEGVKSQKRKELLNFGVAQYSSD